jgi:hypothetical protein
MNLIVLTDITIEMALFRKTSKEWRNKNTDLKGNIRDYATIEQLIVMVSLENMNANFIEKGLEQKQRLIGLNKTAKFKWGTIG